MYYPVVFHPIYKQMVWGGSRLRDLFGRDTPFSRTGESWDIACRKDEMCIVKNGPGEGMAFRTLIRNDTMGILGAKYSGFPRFPLLVKLIDANDNLSVQVHPNDTYAKERAHLPQGKNELWYILEAEPESYAGVGLKDGVTKQDFKRCVCDDKVLECLNKIIVKQGDIIEIPAGLIHTLSKGIVCVEIQQNSDITYRIYDYDRPGLNGEKRELHLRQAIDCTDFTNSFAKTPLNPRLIYKHEGATVYECVKNPYFTVRLLDINTNMQTASDPETFHILTIVQGDMYIEHAGGSLNLSIGDSVFIPAALGDYTISGHCKALLSY